MTNYKARILCVEDDMGLARLMQRRLERYGLEVLLAANGAAALELLEQERVDVIAIDYEMPQMDGLRLLEALAQRPKSPPAIMISGAGNLDIAVAAMKLGAADYVVKAVDGSYLELLPATIERVLEKERLRAEKEEAQRLLAAQKALLDLTLRSISQGISVFGPDRRLLAWNDHWLRLFDYPPELVAVGTPAEELVQFRRLNDAGCNDDEAIAALLERVEAGAEERFEYVRGSGRVIEVSSSPLSGGGFVSLYTDISERKRAEQEQKLAAAVFQTSAEPMLITSPQGQIVRVNPAFEQLLGYTGAELVDESPRLLASGRHDEQFYEEFWQTLVKEGNWRGAMWNRHRSGEPMVQRVTISAVRDEHGSTSHYVAVYSDITEENRREQEIAHRAYHDALTGLPNRSLLLDRLEQAIAAAERDGWKLGVLFLDLDGFKPVNDRYGHRMGDLLLQQLSDRLREACRAGDTVARLGGDEFVVLLRNLPDGDSAVAFADKLIRAVRAPFSIEGIEHRIGTSVGIALYPDHARSAGALIRAADDAMYEVKRFGKGTWRLAGAVG